ncbi:MAG: sulfatase-like hydrolase/transferase [Thiohalocapsa sp.]|nr:sulfatase-like hydrolase/transferase [Thiohalocapsa sp.]MCF7989801.1 sulfatase-like hydrolase/transferase [Thiohalocapsa sp.]
MLKTRKQARRLHTPVYLALLVLFWSAPPALPAPAAPEALSASSESATSILLLWEDRSNDETGFSIERRAGQQNFKQIAQVGADTSSYRDSGLRAGSLYSYRVRAQDTAGTLSGYSNTAAATTGRLNVLFIAVDDLRPELGAYGVDSIQTPNIDALAREGTKFTRAYAQMSTCTPSRTSLMTGLRPDSAGVTDLHTHFRDTVPSVVTLPQYFQQNGYETQGICKIYHVNLDDAQSWSRPYRNFWGINSAIGPDGKRLPYAGVDAAESRFPDGACADYAVTSMRNLKDGPFFLGVGFKKPHLPFVAPQSYFDLYDPNAIPEAPNPFRASGAPHFAFENMGELRRYSGIPAAGQPYSTALRRGLKWGYYAATSFIDAQVGRLLDELRRNGLEDSTLVVLWGDHGWHLGEQAVWGKHTNFEVGTRVPLILRVPGQQPGQTSSAIVELVDLYPTIAELAGLPIPGSQQRGGHPLQGDSFAALIDDPTGQSRRGAFSQWRRDGYTGRSLRTERYRFTKWTRSGSATAYELYDHDVDPAETVNVAGRQAYAGAQADLEAALSAGGQQDLPPTLLADDDGQQPPAPDDPLPEPVARAGHEWVWVADTSGYADPVVIAGAPSFNGGHPGVVRLRDVGSTGFEIRFQEWDYRGREFGDFWHAEEDIPYLVLPAGRHTMADGSIWEVGKFEIDGNKNWRSLRFSTPFAYAPRLFLTVQTENDFEAVGVRANAVDASGFRAALLEEQASKDGHGAEIVGYLAILSPTGTGNFDFGGASRPYRLHTRTLTHEWAPVSGARMMLEEERSADSEVWHTPEEVHLLSVGDAIFAQQVTDRGKDTTALRRD